MEEKERERKKKERENKIEQYLYTTEFLGFYWINL